MRRMLMLVVLLALIALPAGAQVPSDGTGGAASCHIRGALQDPRCTPGAVLITDAATVCAGGYAASVRDVTDATKQTVYAEYGISDHAEYVIDHLVSLQNGGSNALANLWPERLDGWPGAKEKDLIEGALHRAVCAGRVSLTDAQRWTATDWRMALLEPAT